MPKFSASLPSVSTNVLLSLPMSHIISGAITGNTMLPAWAIVAYMRASLSDSGTTGAAGAGGGVSVIGCLHFELERIVCRFSPPRQVEACQAEVNRDDRNHPLG